MKSKVGTIGYWKKEYKARTKDMGMTHDEALEDIIGDLVWMATQYRNAATKWEKDHERLKNKYEPMTAEFSG